MNVLVEEAGGAGISPTTEPDGDRAAGAGIHDVLKKTDFWFNYELSLLEKDAEAMAEAHARAGLPRQDIETEEELAVETTLRSRAEGVFIGWAERVRRKAQDEVQEACTTAADALGQMRHTLALHRLTQRDIAGIRGKLQQSQAAGVGATKTTQYEGLLGRRLYLGLLIFLVFVDWLANAPVFAELFPKEAGADGRWQDLVAHAEKFGLFSGLYTLAARVLAFPETSIIALGALVFLMWLCHIAGASVRKLVVFRPAAGTSAASELRLHRRQAWFPLCSGIAGITLVLGFLFFARGEITPMTLARQAQAVQLVAELEKESLAAKGQNDFTRIEATERQLGDAQSALDDQKNRVAYAASISAMNLPILLLNLTLVLAALAAAYMESNATVQEMAAGDPRTAELDGKLGALRREALGQKESLRKLGAAFESSVAKARYLEQALPLRDWSAKAKRLEAVIPHFRAENARMRGIDVQNIRPFQCYRALQLPSLDDEVALRASAELAQWEIEFEQLSREIALAGKAPARVVEGGSL